LFSIDLDLVATYMKGKELAVQLCGECQRCE
jgi:hypothetical protein